MWLFCNVSSALIVEEIDLIRKLWSEKGPTNLLILRGLRYKKDVYCTFGLMLILLEQSVYRIPSLALMYLKVFTLWITENIVSAMHI